MSGLFVFVGSDGDRHAIPARRVSLHTRWKDKGIGVNASWVVVDGARSFIVDEPFDLLRKRLEAVLGGRESSDVAVMAYGMAAVGAAVVIAGELLDRAPEGPLSDRLAWCLAQCGADYTEEDRRILRDGALAAAAQEALG